MGQVLRAQVLKGRYTGETVRISNISADESGRKKAACILKDGSRANILLDDLSLIEDKPEALPEKRFAKTASMPFVSGAASSRTLTQTKNMGKNRIEVKSSPTPTKVTLALCESCGQEYNLEERKGRPGKITQCEACAELDATRQY